MKRKQCLNFKIVFKLPEIPASVEIAGKEVRVKFFFLLLKGNNKGYCFGIVTVTFTVTDGFNKAT